MPTARTHAARTHAAPTKRAAARSATTKAAAKKAAPAPTPTPAPAAAAAPAPTPVPAKHSKVKAKLVRDGFTMPQADFDLIDALKARALKFQRPAKKSELLRAGLHVLTSLDDQLLRQALDALVPLKTGRPRKAD